MSMFREYSLGAKPINSIPDISFIPLSLLLEFVLVEPTQLWSLEEEIDLKVMEVVKYNALDSYFQ